LVSVYFFSAGPMAGSLWRRIALVLLSLLILPTLTHSQQTGLCAPKGLYKGALIYLFPRHRIAQMGMSLTYLFRNFNDQYRYRVFLFHDEDCKAQAVAELRNTLTPRQMCLLRFYHITHQFPPGFSAQKALKKGVVFQSLFPGYAHMISFWWKTIFEHPKVRELEYYMRMDTDSVITSPVPYDWFDVMSKGGFTYGYRMIQEDPEWVIKGMWRFYRKYVMKTLGFMPPAVASVFPKEKDVDTAGAPIYYNNFEVVYVPFFTERKDVQRFINEFYFSHYIYTHRWGDAPLRYLLINTFLNASKDVRQFCEVNYIHYPGLCFDGCNCIKIA